MLIESKKDLMVLKQCLQDEMDFHCVAEIEGHKARTDYEQADVMKLLNAVNTNLKLMPSEENEG